MLLAMKKRAKDKFTTTEVGVLIEALRAEIRPVLEAIPSFKEKLDSIFEHVGKNAEKIELNRLLIGNNAEKIGINTEKIDCILEQLKSKVDRKDFKTLEKQIASLTG